MLFPQNDGPVRRATAAEDKKESKILRLQPSGLPLHIYNLF